MIAYWLLGLAPVAAVGYVWWAYRRRSAQHAALRQERVAQLLEVPGGAAAAAATVPAARSPVPEPSALPYSSRPRLLGPAHGVLYYLLKSALPDYHVFAHVNLAAVIEVSPQAAGVERDERRRAIAPLAIDCVVSSKALGVVAAIDLAPEGVGDSTFKSECLKAAGVKYLRVDPLRLPKRHAVRAWVLGGTAAAS